MVPVPYRFEPTATAAEIHERFADLDKGAETGERVTVAGRLMLRREMGKLAFGTLQDSTGRVQVFAGAAWTPEFGTFVALSLGDWIGATGEVVATKTGELSVKVDEWTVLATARRQFPDKWHGMTDVERATVAPYIEAANAAQGYAVTPT